MRNQYKITEKTVKVEFEIEDEVVETLKAMEKYSKHSVSELANTAIRRFISAHKDFLPGDQQKRLTRQA